MSEEKNIEENTEGGKSERREEIHDNENVNRQSSMMNKELATENFKLQTQNMEVHHHPHVEKKNFKEYFLEFIMIFLAVTLGFFAENVREGLSENTKEKEYMESMVEDLKADTSKMAQAISDWKTSNSSLDSILTYLKKEPDSYNVSQLYHLFNENYWHFDLFKYNNKTIEELKSSGNYRLIRKKDIANQVISYDLKMKYILVQEQDVKELMVTAKNTDSKIFDFSQLASHHYGPADTSFLKGNKKPYYLLSYDKQLIGEYFNKLLSFRLLAYRHEQLFEESKQEAIALLENIQKEYQ